MRVLLDSCVSGTFLPPLKAAGHDVLWTGSWPKDPGDEEILAFANREERVLITLDKDFGALAILHGYAHAGIVRIAHLSLADQLTACLHILTEYTEELARGAIITVDQNRVRIRSWRELDAV